MGKRLMNQTATDDPLATLLTALMSGDKNNIQTLLESLLAPQRSPVDSHLALPAQLSLGNRNHLPNRTASGTDDLLYYPQSGVNAPTSPQTAQIVTEGPWGTGQQAPSTPSQGGAPVRSSGGGSNQLPANSAIPSSVEDFVAGLEGFNPNAYSDYSQTSIGYGTKAPPGVTRVDEQTGRQLLRQELDRFSGAVDSMVKVPLTNNQRTSLISLLYNLGEGGAKGIIDKVNSGDYQGAAQSMLGYNHAGGRVLPGLTARRQKEASLFMTPDSNTPISPVFSSVSSPSPQLAAPTFQPISYTHPDASPPSDPTYPDDSQKWSETRNQQFRDAQLLYQMRQNPHQNSTQDTRHAPAYATDANGFIDNTPPANPVPEGYNQDGTFNPYYNGAP